MSDVQQPSKPSGLLIPEWRIAHRLWSVRIAVFWTLISSLYMALPAFVDLVPPWAFAALCIAFGLAILGARLTHQPGLK